MSVEDRIKAISQALHENKEVAIFYDGLSWNMTAENPTSCVMLGEVWGNLNSEGITLEKALTEMEDAIRNRI